jgi:hypothetical protein
MRLARVERALPMFKFAARHCTGIPGEGPPTHSICPSAPSFKPIPTTNVHTIHTRGLHCQPECQHHRRRSRASGCQCVTSRSGSFVLNSQEYQRQLAGSSCTKRPLRLGGCWATWSACLNFNFKLDSDRGNQVPDPRFPVRPSRRRRRRIRPRGPWPAAPGTPILAESGNGGDSQ